MSYRDRSVGKLNIDLQIVVNFKVGECNSALVLNGLIVSLFTQHHSRNLLTSHY